MDGMNVPSGQHSFLVIFPKSASDELIQESMGEIRPQLEARLKSVPALMHSITWYTETFDRCGDWDPWVHETVFGVDYVSRKPHFDGFVVRYPRVGLATANLIQTAIRAGRPVVAAFAGSRLKRVTSVIVEDENDWIGGWCVNTADFSMEQK